MNNSTRVIRVLSYKFNRLIEPATYHNINTFPKTLTSLTTQNPTNEQIENDVKRINSFYNHPLLKNHFPTYYEVQKYTL